MRIPLEVTTDNRILTRARLNGSEPLWFILDSGAGASVLDVRLAKDLKLKPRGRLRVDGAGEKYYDAPTLEESVMEFPASHLIKQNFAAVPLEFLEPYFGRTVSGVIGPELLSRYVVEIDYEEKTISLYQQGTYQYSGASESIPITLEANLPYVRAEIEMAGREPVEGRFLIDTGAHVAVLLSRPFVEAHHLLESSVKTIPDPWTLGIGGETMFVVGRAAAVQLGSFRLARPEIGFSRDKKGAFASPGFDGVIGGELLRRFNVIFDYSRRRVVLEPNAHLADQYMYSTEMSGIGLSAEGEDLKTFKVHRIVKDSPAARAGLRAGDAILTIDGQPAGSFTLDQMQRLFKQTGGRRSLVIRRGAKELRVEMQFRARI